MRVHKLVIALSILAVPAAASAEDGQESDAYRPPPAPGLGITPVQAADEGEAGSLARIGRVSRLTGEVWWFVESTSPGDWIRAEPNFPIVSRSSLSTLPGARAEVRLGNTMIALDGDSQADFVRIANGELVLRVARGSVSVSIPPFDEGDAIELGAGEARLLPRMAGTYTLRNDPATGRVLAKVRDGRADLRAGVQTLALVGGLQAGVDAAGSQVHEHGGIAVDSFDHWVAEREDYWDAAVPSHYVSAEMTGADVLASHGQWEHDQAHGTIWYPATVETGWSPYQEGRWRDLQPWGRVWVATAPWGFATSWYGRWHRVHDRWGWVPGSHARRPVFHPPAASELSRVRPPLPGTIAAPILTPFPPRRDNSIPQPPRTFPRAPRIDLRTPGPYPDPPRAFPYPPRKYPTPPRSWPSAGR